MKELELFSNYADLVSLYPETKRTDEEKLQIIRDYFKEFNLNVRKVLDGRELKGEIPLEQWNYQNYEMLQQYLEILKVLHFIPENKQLTIEIMKTVKSRIDFQIKKLKG